MTMREDLRGALTNVLSNATSYPDKVQARLLGQDMGPLTEKVTDVALAVFERSERSGVSKRGRQAMVIEYPDGHRDYSPEVEITNNGDGTFAINAIVPFERMDTRT